jgi:Mg-chelatase subunit ChlI
MGNEVKLAIQNDVKLEIELIKIQWLIYPCATEDRVCGTIDIEKH